jgi:hypothetical protein
VFLARNIFYVNADAESNPKNPGTAKGPKIRVSILIPKIPVGVWRFLRRPMDFTQTRLNQ